MSDLREALERERRRFRMPEGSGDDLERRRDARRRNARVLSGVVALAVAGVGAVGVFIAFRDTDPPFRPAISPPVATESPKRTILSPTPSSKLQFLDSNLGWMAIGRELLVTRDGGRTWTPQLLADEEITGLQFVDRQHGWAASMTQLWGTTDGGASWEGLGNRVLTSFQFLSPKVGWGVEGGQEESVGLLVKSEDGGQTWRSHDLQVNSVCFGDLNGW